MSGNLKVMYGVFCTNFFRRTNSYIVLFVFYSLANLKLKRYEIAKAALEKGSSYANDLCLAYLLGKCEKRIAGKKNL